MKYEKIAQNKKAYNQMGIDYLRNRQELGSKKYVRKFFALLEPQSSILDLGCGAGEPVDDFLIKKGHLVTGIDISETQINLARQKCPRGAFLVKDISELKEGEFSVDAIISLYTIFHVPREQHGKLLKVIASFLPTGGKLLITMGDKDFEQDHDLHGQIVWSSHYSTKKNRQLVEEAGFDVLLDEVSEAGREKHQFILAEKK